MKTLADLYLQSVMSRQRTLTDEQITRYMLSTKPSATDHLIPALQYLARYGDPANDLTIWDELKDEDYTRLIDTQTKLELGYLAPPKVGRPRKLVKAKQPSGAAKRRKKRLRSGSDLTSRDINRIAQDAAQDFLQRMEDAPDQDT